MDAFPAQNYGSEFLQQPIGMDGNFAEPRCVVGVGRIGGSATGIPSRQRLGDALIHRPLVILTIDQETRLQHTLYVNDLGIMEGAQQLAVPRH